MSRGTLQAKHVSLRATASGLALVLLAAGCGTEQLSGDAREPASPGAYRREAPEVLKGTVASRALEPQVGAGGLERLVGDNTAFALSLLEQISAERPGENVAFGPYSVSQAMAMVYAGARGQTQAEMKAALHYGLDAAELHAAFNRLDSQLAERSREVVLRNVNQVWMQPGFDVHTEYLDVLTRDYGAPLAQVNFASEPEAGRAIINRWVEESTEERIAELLPAGTIDALTALVLSNAMYLDAPWHFAFPREATAEAAFTLADGTPLQVPTLQLKAPLRSAEGDGWQAVVLPYRGEQLAMLVVVPSDLASFEASLTTESLAAMRSQLVEQQTQVTLPRFELGSHVSLKDSLQALGLGSLFEAPDLSGMTDHPVWLGAVEHEAFVEVTEEGTRAAAATAATVQTRSTPATVAVNRPFLFFVMDEPTGSVLFLGKVLDRR